MINIDWNTIPTDPGVYLWKDKHNQVIYVGKAKNLRNRMKQYFITDLPPKNKLLVKNIVNFDYQISSSEIDALLLEETLINKYEPKYNIKIKSSKTYPYIEFNFTNDISLKTSKTLKFKKGTKYFGPYPSGFNANRLINILGSALPIDKCLKPKSGTPCLNYEMDRCLGQCINQENLNKKEFVINQINEFFKGNTEYVIDKINNRINKNNEILNFEESKKLFESLELLNKLNKQKIVKFKDTKHRDIINVHIDEGIVSLSIMYIRFGSINLTTNFISKELNTNVKDIIESFIYRYYKKHLIPNEIIVPVEIDINNELNISTPTSGIKKELLDLTYEHAFDMYKTNIESFINKQKGYEDAIKFINDNISDKNINTIDMVDISSTMGSEQVGAVVRFVDGNPSTTNYRKYIIKSINKMDDYTSTNEVVERHFNNILEDDRELPDLFVVDGKHQISMVTDILNKLNIDSVLVIGLIKNDKHNTESIIDVDGNIYNLDKKSNMYLFFGRIQEEVHRFVIRFHRSRREKTIINSKLNEFTFLTETDKQNLFKEFKSIRRILIASEAELKKVLTPQKVKKLLEEK